MTTEIEQSKSSREGWAIPCLLIFGSTILAGFLVTERPFGGLLLALAVIGGAIALLAKRDWQDKVFAPIGINNQVKRSVVLGMTIMFMLVTLGSSDREKADALWAEGKKLDAVELYTSDLNGPGSLDLKVLKRVIEYWFEKGDEEQAKRYCSRAIEADMDLVLEPNELRNLFDSLVSEKKQEEELAQKKLAEEKRQTELAVKTQDNKSMAWVMATGFVKDHLKSPSTASFGGLVNHQDSEKQVIVLGDNLYQVSGWVDSQNSFGATVRSNFKVELQYMGNDKWKLIGKPIIATRL